MKICGIYKITSPSGRIYIGQSIDIKRRWYLHKNFSTKRISRLYYSMKKYGVDNHKFKVIEECAVDLLNERERYWQEYYNVLCQHKGLNCRLTATKDKSGKFSEETCKKIGQANRLKKVKDSTRIKCRIRCTGSGNPRALLVINLETGIYYGCVKDAAETINVTRKTLSNRLNGLQYNHTSFRYVNPDSNNLLIHKCDVSKTKGGKNKSIILNTDTGIYYEGLEEAGFSIGKSWKPIFDCVKGKSKRRKLPFIQA